jgi:hypothetical protein
MIMAPRVRKLVLTAHVASSVGWLGAVVAFLGLAVVGVTNQDAQTVRGAYLVMEPAAWLVLVPLAFASLLTGLIQSLGTTWGLFRHYWVVFKLLLNLMATIVLLTYMETFAVMARWQRIRVPISAWCGMRPPGSTPRSPYWCWWWP